jgi:hypothetical protein
MSKASSRHSLRGEFDDWLPLQPAGTVLPCLITSAAKEDATQIPEPGKQYGFAFDGIGNRSSSTVSSLADNEVLRSTGYTANALNQYEEITHPSPGWLVLRGSANT